MGVIKVLIKGTENIIEFPDDTAIDVIEKSIKGNWESVERLSGLPMDTASRMDRARHLGFDPDETFFHGTKGDFPEFIAGGPEGVSAGELFGSGIYTSRNPNVADSFISGEGANIINLKTSGKFFNKNTKLTAEESTKINKFINENHPELMERFANDFGVKRKRIEFGKTEKVEGINTFKDAQKKIKESGLPDRFKPTTSKGDNGAVIVDLVDVDDAVDFGSRDTKDFVNSLISSGQSSDILEDLGYSGLDYSDTERLIFDPKNIRSVNAAFDPANRQSGNLLGGLTAGAVGVGALTASDESEAATGEPETLGLFSQISDMITGADRMTPEMERLKEIGSSPELNEFSKAAFKTSLGLLTTGDTEKLKTLITNNIPSAKFRQDAKGNTIVDLPSGSFALDKPGISPQDVARTAFDIASFMGAGRVAGIGTTLRGAELGAGVGGLTRLGIDVAGQAAGTSDDVSLANVDPLDVAIETALGGAARPAEQFGRLAKKTLFGR
jgi:hypothetical protein